jgi:putative endonuclease
MFYIYILYSPSSDFYYVGYSNDPVRRLEEHNSSVHNTFTSKHRPWILKAYFKCSESEKEAIQIERFIKKQKSRKLLEQLCTSDFVPHGRLAPLVRVPHVQDTSRVIRD